MAAGSDVVVTVGGTFTVIVSDFVPDTPLASVAATVKVCEVALAPTVPDITPLLPVKLRPVGKVPPLMLQIMGAVPPVEARVWE